VIPAEGAFASRNPRTVLLAGAYQFKAADPDGLIVGRFGFADYETAFAANARTKAAQRLAFVLPLANGYAIRTRRGFIYARPGVAITLMQGGDFWARFAYGASAGQQVYASQVDGAAISGQADGAEPTQWFVVTDAQPGGLAIISTTCKVTS
jgi:hypothetical protein